MPDILHLLPNLILATGVLLLMALVLAGKWHGGGQ